MTVLTSGTRSFRERLLHNLIFSTTPRTCDQREHWTIMEPRAPGLRLHVVLRRWEWLPIAASSAGALRTGTCRANTAACLSGRLIKVLMLSVAVGGLGTVQGYSIPYLM